MSTPTQANPSGTPQVGRRLSSTSLRVSLADLPNPRLPGELPSGQRSVPALDKPASLFAAGLPVENSAPQTPASGTLTPGASGALGLNEQPWNLFGADSAPLMDNSLSSESVKTTFSQSSETSPIRHNGIGRSASYTGDVIGSSGEARPIPPNLRRADTQRERHKSSLGTVTSATEEQSASMNTTTGQRVNNETTKQDTRNFDIAASMGSMHLNAPQVAEQATSPSSSNLNRVWGPQPPQQTQPAWQQETVQQQQQPVASPYTGFYSPSAYSTNSDITQYVEPYSDYSIYRRDSGYATGIGSPMDAITPQHTGGYRRPSANWDNQMQFQGRQSSTGFPAVRQVSAYSPQTGSYQSPVQQPFYPPATRSTQRFTNPTIESTMRGSAYASGMVASGYATDPYGGMPGALRYEDRPRGVRSRLLEEFRANRHRQWDLVDLQGHIAEFSSDQLGSRHLQTKLETAAPEERRIFFEELTPNILTLSTDLFSNYVVQKAFEVADQSQRPALVKALGGNVLTLSLQMYGCRVVQKAIESVAVDDQVQIVSELRDHVMKCAKDQNANHVLQRTLERVPADRIRFIPEACQGQVFQLATHPYGCRVLQRILENTSDVRPLIDELLRYTQNLMQDQYSNYVVQHLLERGTLADRAVIINVVRGQLLSLSQHKFASNVVDKVILCANDDERRLLTDELLYDPANVPIMLRDQFANYCLQKFMLVIQGPLRQELMGRVADALIDLKKHGGMFGKHLVAIERFIANEQALASFNQPPPMPHPAR